MENIMEEQIIEPTDFVYKPSLMFRIKSTLIDGLVVILLMFICSTVLNNLNVESGIIRGLAMGIILLYEPIFVVLGNTIGQKIMGLEVVNSNTYKEEGKKEKINFIYSVLRYISKVMLGWISLLTIHSDSYGQAIHDKVGNSMMIRK